MKILLIIPGSSEVNSKSFYGYSFYAEFLLTKKYISYLLAIPTLAALTPKKHEIKILDENIEEIDYKYIPDVVGISVRTMYAPRAYEISRNYRKLGAKTVLGGIHPSMCPEEASMHCDSVVIGEAENIWAKLLEDVENGNLQKFYKAEEKVDLSRSPVPARKFLSRSQYISDILQTTKGCPFHCEFCSVHAFDGQKIRNRPIDQVIKDVLNVKQAMSKYKSKQAIFIADDNIIANRKYARELFIALKPHNINWMCQASINISQEDELLQLMSESGCGAVFIGFESISDDNLSSMDKGINKKFNYVDAINKIQSYGLLVHSSFIVGYDFDSQKTFRELVDFIQESKLLMPLINVLTPFPGTKLFKRFEEENRILHKEWAKYDTKNVVFQPVGMPPEELSEGYKKIVQEIYSFDSILEKLKYYWDIDFWKRSNELDPVKFKYRFLFAFRMATLLFSRNAKRSRFILQILPHIFRKEARISTILTLMAYNDFAYSI
ncbi:B12-binding domain-containing radical SAM protein [Desulforegula conservatrix]|uniref:B12-binding domain-containing radical SAM protein n=1 Tax=Desulforegula conservatrix TaxID=153026 RepID=UPI000420832A|nr:B12-binding domain-containing radical SAM protein [Desulforegula conservatrix]